jgi:hypothetical protein
MNGLCTGHSDPDLWFSDTLETIGSGSVPKAQQVAMLERARQALAICNKCPIIKECLEEGMKSENVDWGIWGGTLSGERLVMKRKIVKGTDRIRKVVFANRVRGLQSQ